MDSTDEYTTAYIICLQKTTETRCTPTFNAWQGVASAHNVNVETLTAITPDDFDLVDYVHPYVYNCIKEGSRKTLDLLGSSVETACALSHMKAWQTIVDSGKPGIVVEDDMAMSNEELNTLLSQLSDMPSDSDMFLLHFTGINFRYTPRKDGFIDVQSFVGGMCYYLTVETAKKFLQYATPLVFQVDTFMSSCIGMLDLKVRSSLSNQLSVWKAATDCMASTLGTNHVSSTLLSCIVSIVVLSVGVVTLGSLCAAWAIRQLKETQ